MTTPEKQMTTRKPHYLAAWRKARNLKQEDAAAALGISQPTLSKIENGRIPYSQDLLELAATIYQTTPAALISLHPDRASNMAEIQHIFEDMSEEGRIKYINILKEIRKL